MAVFACLALLSQAPVVLSDEPNRANFPIAEFRWIHPDQQLRSLLNLFEGARYPHPAAAMTAWKLARGEEVKRLQYRIRPGEEGSLGKPLEAVITLLNPEMVAELRSLHQATLLLDRSPIGDWSWSAVVPTDDGTFSALITAMTLTDGVLEEPLPGGAVHRLGPPGSPLAWVRARQIRIASTRAMLSRDQERNLTLPEIEAGLTGAVQLDALGSRLRTGTATTWERAVGKAAAALKAQFVTMAVTSAESNDSARLIVRGEFTDQLGSRSEPVRPEWLARLPWKRAAVVGGMGIDPSVASWNRSLELLDAIDRASPARSGLAPLGVRVTLAAAAAGLRPEFDLWGKLRGLTFCAWGELRGDQVVPTWIVVAPARDRQAAEEIQQILRHEPANPAGKNRGGFLPRLVALPSDWLRNLSVREDRVVLVSDEIARAALLEAEAAGELPPWPKLAVDAELSTIQRVMRVQPDRVPSGWLASLPAALATAISHGPPVVWAGGQSGNRSRDWITLTGLKPVVRQWLEQVPIPPMPASARSREIR